MEHVPYISHISLYIITAPPPLPLYSLCWTATIVCIKIFSSILFILSTQLNMKLSAAPDVWSSEVWTAANISIKEIIDMYKDFPTIELDHFLYGNWFMSAFLKKKNYDANAISISELKLPLIDVNWHLLQVRNQYLLTHLRFIFCLH